MLFYFKTFIVTLQGFFPTGRINENHESNQTYLRKVQNNSLSWDYRADDHLL